jgi:glycosyltransferase involved in cell wall biosynthesis
MKVILSIEPVRFPLTGIGRYTYELARHLQKSAEITDLRFFAGRKFLPRLPLVEDQAGQKHKLKQFVQGSYLASEAYRLLMPYLKAQALSRYDDYIYHGPNFFLPPFAGPKVATFHDLSPFTWAQCNTPQRIRYMQKELRKTLDTANALITDSEYTRQELANYFSWPIEKIHAVPLACSEEFHPRSVEELKPLLQQYGLKKDEYTLFVGTIEPRKNIIALLDAYAMLPLVIRQRWPLVLTGYQGWRSDAIHARIRKAESEGWAKYLGFLPAEQLPLLFAGARLFAFPSLYEGFGLPVLEAMASGIPVVCSDSSSLPEVVGDVALMVTAEDIYGLSQLLERGLQDDIWRAQAREQGLERAKGFSWAYCAQQTTKVYSSIWMP